MTTSELFDDVWRGAREAWPDVVVTRDELFAYVTALHPELASVTGDLPKLAYTDLYLACACARGDAAAVAAFEAHFEAECEHAARRLGGPSAPPVEEVRQILHHRLFVAEPGARPKITEYAGRGDLRTWVRISAVRLALNLTKRAAREIPFESNALGYLAGGGADPELQFIKRMYQEEFRAAFTEACRALPSRERNLLRYAFSERMTVDEIGTLYGVHRATAARWVVKAHERLVLDVKAAMRGRLRVDDSEYASILRLIESQLEITLEKRLAATDPGTPVDSE